MTTNRLSTHVQAEQQALVGYPYPNRQHEREFALENLPSRQGFDNLLSKVHEDWNGCSRQLLAELLTGTSKGGQFDALLKEWDAAPTQTPPAPRQKTSAELEIYDGTWEETR